MPGRKSVGRGYNLDWSGKVSLGIKKIKCFVQWLTSRKDSQKSYHYSFLYLTLASIE